MCRQITFRLVKPSLCKLHRPLRLLSRRREPAEARPEAEGAVPVVAKPEQVARLEVEELEPAALALKLEQEPIRATRKIRVLKTSSLN